MLQLRNNPTVPKFNKGIFKVLLPHVTTSIKKVLQRIYGFLKDYGTPTIIEEFHRVRNGTKLFFRQMKRT